MLNSFKICNKDQNIQNQLYFQRKKARKKNYRTYPNQPKIWNQNFLLFLDKLEQEAESRKSKRIRKKKKEKENQESKRIQKKMIDLNFIQNKYF